MHVCSSTPPPPSLSPSGAHEEDEKRLVETDGLAHGRLDVERLDVLPVLLEQGDEEVDACGSAWLAMDVRNGRRCTHSA